MVAFVKRWTEKQKSNLISISEAFWKEMDQGATFSQSCNKPINNSTRAVKGKHVNSWFHCCLCFLVFVLWIEIKLQKASCAIWTNARRHGSVTVSHTKKIHTVCGIDIQFDFFSNKSSLATHGKLGGTKGIKIIDGQMWKFQKSYSWQQH